MKLKLNKQPLATSAGFAAKPRPAWGVYWFCGICLLAVFIGLELSKPQAAPPQELSSVPAVAEEAPVTEEPVTAPEQAPQQEEIPNEAQPQPELAVGPQPQTQPTAPVPAPEAPSPTPRDEAELMAAETDLTLVGMDAGRETAKSRDRALLQRALQGRAWDAYRGLLARSIAAGLAAAPPGGGLNRYDGVWKEPALYQALLRWRTLGFFQQSHIAPLAYDSYTGAVLLWLLQNNAAMEECLLTVQPQDDPAAVLKFLIDAWAVSEKQFEKYFPLALACAVVFDQPMRVPYAVGKAEYGVERTVDPLKRYQWYISRNEKGKLTAPVHRSSARDLVWAVSAPVTTSELEWSLDKLHMRRKNWGHAYGMVEYLMERAVEGFNPYKEYSFAEILKHGGICADQAYFCVNTARAQGIPAMVISGETNAGGHAWAGIKIDRDEWSTSIGRIGGASKGMTENPQTRSLISEQEILSWNDRGMQSPVVTLSVWRHLWLADYFEAMERDADNAAAVRLASRIGHGFPAAWRALYEVLERETEMKGEPPAPSNLDEWKDFVADMRREFKDNPRMAGLAAEAELAYVFPYGSEGDFKRALQRERRRIERDAGEQADLIAASLKRQAALLHQRGGPNAKREISRLYDRALRDYGGSITGFKMMAEDYFSYSRDDPEQARKAARDIELAFKRVVETGSKEWFRANTEAEIYRMICGYYRSAGEPERAELLEKRFKVLLRRAKRAAL